MICGEGNKVKNVEYYEWSVEMEMGYIKYIWEGEPKMKKMSLEVFKEMGEYLKSLPEPEEEY